MKILISLEENNYSNSKLSKHFGQSKHFALYNTETKKLDISYNPIDHNQESSPVDQIINTYNPDAIFTLKIGKKAIDLFKSKNIKVKTGNYTYLHQVIENIERLNDLDTCCEDD